MIHEIFPTPIIVTNLSEMIDIKDTKETCLDIVGELNHKSVHGIVKDGISSYNKRIPVLTDDRLSFLKKIIMQQIRHIETALGVCPLEITNSWINVMPVGSEVKPHLHQYSVISGCLYLNAEEGAGSFYIENPMVSNHMAYMLKQFGTEYTQPYLEVAVQTGTLILFPSHLRHFVHKNECESRTVLSFNTMYDDRFDKFS